MSKVLEHSQSKLDAMAAGMMQPDPSLPHISQVNIWAPNSQAKTPTSLLTLPTAILEKTREWMACTAEETECNLVISSVIHLAAVTVARAVETNRDNGSALYLIQIARTGEGKNAGKNAVAKAIGRAFNTSVFARFHSGSSIFSALQAEPRAVFHLDEFGDKLGHGLNDRTGSPLADGFSYLKEIYSSCRDPLPPAAFSLTGMRPKERAEFLNANGPVQCPHLNLLAVTTPGQFHDALTEAAVEGGLLNRFVVVHACGEIQENVEPESAPPDWLIEHMRLVRETCQNSGSGNVAQIGICAAGLIPTMRRFCFCAESMRLLDELKRMLKAEAGKDEFYIDMTRRVRENAMRIALALHAFSSPDEPDIDPKITQWAIEYVLHFSRVFINKLYELAAPKETYGKRRKAYLQAFRSKPEGVSSNHIGKHVPWCADRPSMRREIIQDMLGCGQIAEVLGDKPPRGPSPRLYVAIQ